MQRLKKYSGSSTTAGTDLGNDSCIKGNNNKSVDRGFFTSPNELTEPMTILRNPPSIDVSREENGTSK